MEGSSLRTQENNHIQVFGPEGEFIHKFGTFGDADKQFHLPTGITFDTDVNLLGCRSFGLMGHSFALLFPQAMRIKLWAPDGTFRMQFGERGLLDGTFHEPRGVAIDREDNLV